MSPFSLRAICFGILLFLVFVNDSNGQIVDGRQPDQRTVELLQDLQKKNGWVGVVCCVIRENRIVALGSVGKRKYGSSEELTVDDQVHLGSCTKAMTATLAAQLVSEKKMNWETRLLDVFPNLEKEIHQDYHQVTLLDLLTHQAGVPKNNVDGWPQEKPVRTLRFELLQRSLRPKPINEVGGFFYSNLGYIAAGAMMEKVTNQKWENLIKRRLFQKLGMKSAGFGPPGIKNYGVRSYRNQRDSDSNPKATRQPWGHRKNKEGEWVPNQVDNPPLLGPAGTVHCTIRDWARFVALHVSWVKRQPKLLESKALEFLQTPRTRQAYACGWFAVNRKWGNGRVINHNGSNTSWMATVWASPKKDLAVMAVINCCEEDSAKQLDEVVSKMIHRFAY